MTSLVLVESWEKAAHSTLVRAREIEVVVLCVVCGVLWWCVVCCGACCCSVMLCDSCITCC